MQGNVVLIAEQQQLKLSDCIVRVQTKPFPAMEGFGFSSACTVSD